VRIHVGDGRNFLAQSQARFDVIISEPSNPWITGVSNLFTREYWALAHKRLAPHGVFCQWAQLYEMSSSHIKTILRTFASEFPYTYVFAAEDLSSDVILVASDEPLSLDRGELLRRLKEERFGKEAARGGVKAPEDLLAYLLLAPDEIAAFTAGAPINTDDNAIIEFGAPRDLLGYSKEDRYLARVYGEDWPYAHLDGLLGKGTEPFELGRLALALFAHGKTRSAMHFVARAGESAGVAREVAKLLATEPELPTDLEPPRLPPNLPAAELERYAREYTDIERLTKRGGYKEARKILSRWPEAVAEQAGPDLALLHGFICWRAEEYNHALDLLDGVSEDASYLAKRPSALHLLGRVYYTLANYPKGVEMLERHARAAKH
jgi:hypothetical protein